MEFSKIFQPPKLHSLYIGLLKNFRKNIPAPSKFHSPQESTGVYPSLFFGGSGDQSLRVTKSPLHSRGCAFIPEV